MVSDTIVPIDSVRLSKMTPDSVEFEVVEFSWTRLPALTMDGGRVPGLNQDAIVPVSDMLALFGFRVERPSPGILSGRLYPVDEEWELNVPNRTIRRGKIEWKLGAWEIFERDGGVYINTARLKNLLGWTVIADWPNLVVGMDRADEIALLPISAQRARRRAKNIFFVNRSPLEPAKGDSLIAQRFSPLRGLAIDYVGTLAGIRAPIVALGGTIGTQLLGGAFLANVNGGSSQRYEIQPSWLLGLPRNRWIRQIRVGQTSTSNSIASNGIQGIAVGNQPFVLPFAVGSEVYEGEAPAGWEIEAWQQGILVALDSIPSTGPMAGKWRLRVPIGFGQNNIDFRLYGPEGQRQDFNRSRRVAGEVVPTGQVWWGASVGQCGSLGRCSNQQNLDVRYGISSRITLGTGFDLFLPSSQIDTVGGGPESARLNPYGQFVWNPLNAVSLQGRYIQNGLIGGSVRFEPSLQVQTFLSYQQLLRNASGYSPYGILSQPIRWSGGLSLQPGGVGGGIFIGSTFQRIEDGVGGANTLVSARTGFRQRGIQFLPFAQYSWSEQPQGPSLPGRTILGTSALMPLPFSDRVPGGRAQLQLSLESENLRAPDRLNVQINKPVTQILQLQLGATWNSLRSSRSPFVTIGFNSILPFARLSSTINRSTNGRWDGFINGGGSLAWDPPNDRPHFSNLPATLLTGVSGVVYEDRNLNGRRDLGEEGIPQVQMVGDGGRVTTDDQGRYNLRNINSFREVVIGADSLGFAEPTQVAPFRTVGIIATPIVPFRMDIPVVRGGQVDGRIEWLYPDGKRLPLTQQLIEVVAYNPKSREFVRSQGFTDGTYVLSPLRPGRWALTIEGEGLSLFAKSDTTWLTVELKPDGDFIKDILITVRLKPKVRGGDILPPEPPVDSGTQARQPKAATEGQGAGRAIPRDSVSASPREKPSEPPADPRKVPEEVAALPAHKRGISRNASREIINEKGGEEGHEAIPVEIAKRALGGNPTQYLAALPRVSSLLGPLGFLERPALLAGGRPQLLLRP